MTESVCIEADRLVTGARNTAYGPPHIDFAKTAKMMTGVLWEKLKDGCEIDAGDVALLMICVKMSREVNKPGRDNLLDICGYAKCKQLVEEAAG